MEKHTIGGLRKILVTSVPFSDMADYFLTLSETNEAALDGKPGKNKNLLQVISTTLAEVCKQQELVEDMSKITLTRLQMIEVRQRNFWHGVGFIEGKNIFTFFYFTDLDRGLVSVSGKGGKIYFARISAQVVPTDKNPLDDFSLN